ncbi:MAG: trypsin-like serine peptidase, partial [Stackebrandtia sp.]
MRMTFKIASSVLAVGVLSLTTSATASADPAPDETASPTVNEAAVTKAEQDRVRDFWTPDRMRGAENLDLIEVSPDEVDLDVPLGEERVVEPTEADTQAFPEGGGPWEGGGDVVSTAGRVFFTYDGRTASCSGNSVTSDNGSTVLTAGHCVKLEGNWHTDWMFVPAYDNGDAPHGEWVASETMATEEWTASEDMNYDVGAAVVE